MNQPPGSMGAMRSVALGDALQRAVARIYTDTVRLLQGFKDQDPELRTTDLRAFISFNKAKLLQLLCIVRWLNKPNVTHLFHSLAQYSVDISLIDAVLARNLDEMYFIHGFMYPLRSSKHECKLARHIVATGGYPALPLATSTAGRKPFPEDIPSIELKTRLSIFIRAKLALVDPMPKDERCVIRVADGRLLISIDNVLTVELTLQALSRSAPWVVVQFTCPRVFGHADVTSSHPAGSELNLLAKLLDQTEGSHSLAKILSLCEHISNRIQIRGMYEYLRHKPLAAFTNSSSIRYTEDRDSHCLWIYFWKSDFTGQDLFAIKALSPTVGDGASVVPATSLSVVIAATDEALPLGNDLLPDLRHLLAFRGSVSDAINTVLTVFAQIKLLLLGERWRHATSCGPAEFTERMVVEQSTHAVELQLLQSAARVTFTVDVQTGAYCAGPNVLAPLPSFLSSELGKVLAELNNVSAEAFVKQCLSSAEFLSRLTRVEGSAHLQASPGGLGVVQELISTLPHLLLLMDFHSAYVAMTQHFQSAEADEHVALAASYRRKQAIVAGFRLAFGDEQDQRLRFKDRLEEFLQKPALDKSVAVAAAAARSSASVPARRVEAINTGKVVKVGAQERPRRPLRVAYLVVSLSAEDGLQAQCVTMRCELVQSKLGAFRQLSQEALLTAARTADPWPFAAEACALMAAKGPRHIFPSLAISAHTALTAGADIMDVRMQNDRVLCFALGSKLLVACLAPSDGCEAPCGDELRHCLRAHGVAPGDAVMYFCIRHYVREMCGTLLHSWALDGLGMRAPQCGDIWPAPSVEEWAQISAQVHLAAQCLATSFCASSDGEYKSGAQSAVVTMRALFVLMMAGWFQQIAGDGGGGAWLRLRPAGISTNTAMSNTSPLEVVVAVERCAGGRVVLEGYVSVTAHCGCFRPSYNAPDKIVVSGLARNALAVLAPLEIHTQSLCGIVASLADTLRVAAVKSLA